MLKWMRKRLSDDSGFTLIELMVVVLIIAVLVAIAIPSFIGFRNNAQDRAAQSDLRNVLLAEQANWTERNDYTSAVADLNDYEPSIVLDADPKVAVSAEEAEVAATGEDVVCLERTSASNKNYAVWVSSVDGTYYGVDVSGAGLLASPCPAAPPALGTAGDVTWSQGGW